MKRIIILAMVMGIAFSTSAQTAQEILQTAKKVNAYFMAKHADPTKPTFVKKIRPSSLWTRAVYYEGLMDLQAIDPNPSYLNYALTWADFHQWQPRDGVTTTDADNQCCCQTYLSLLPLVGNASENRAKATLENLDHQISTNRHDYWTWIDAIQMAMPVYVEAYKLTHQQKYLDYAMSSYRWSRNQCGGGTL